MFGRKFRRYILISVLTHLSIKSRYKTQTRSNAESVPAKVQISGNKVPRFGSSSISLSAVHERSKGIYHYSSFMPTGLPKAYIDLSIEGEQSLVLLSLLANNFAFRSYPENLHHCLSKFDLKGTTIFIRRYFLIHFIQPKITTFI